jgi:hypothetical protein
MARWLAVWAGSDLGNASLPQKVPEKDDEYFRVGFLNLAGFFECRGQSLARKVRSRWIEKFIVTLDHGQ